jgi:Small subunit of serine palmitoyltransferase-like
MSPIFPSTMAKTFHSRNIRPDFLHLKSHKVEYFKIQSEDTQALPTKHNLNSCVPTFRAPAFTKYVSFKALLDGSQLRNLWHHIQILQYRFEVTFGPYVMDTPERIVFYVVFLSVLAAMAALLYYPTVYVAHQLWQSLPATHTLQNMTVRNDSLAAGVGRSLGEEWSVLAWSTPLPTGESMIEQLESTLTGVVAQCL